MKKNVILGVNAEEYMHLQKRINNLPLLAQGNVFAIEPAEDAPRATTYYKWTRKCGGKTISTTLSKVQYKALERAIKANQNVEMTLQRMRELAQDAILESLPDSPRKQARKASQTALS